MFFVFFNGTIQNTIRSLCIQFMMAEFNRALFYSWKEKKMWCKI